jgi:hypothetical protein
VFPGGRPQLGGQCDRRSLASQSAQAQFFQEGEKLVGSGAAQRANQGHSLALSADGNTLIVGGYVTTTVSVLRGCLTSTAPDPTSFFPCCVQISPGDDAR